MPSFQKLPNKIGKVFFSIFSDSLLYYDNNFAYLTWAQFLRTMPAKATPAGPA